MTSVRARLALQSSADLVVPLKRCHTHISGQSVKKERRKERKKERGRKPAYVGLGNIVAPSEEEEGEEKDGPEAPLACAHPFVNGCQIQSSFYSP